MSAATNLVHRVRAALARIESDPTPSVWIERVAAETVLAEAAEVDRRLAAGDDLPLAGLTVAVKGNIDVAGLRTTAAHPEFGDVAAHDAEAVARLRAAGAIVMGSTNMDQFATGLVGTRSPFGAPESATHPGRISGGSSSGSAVAVARGLVDLALGTDTAGSGRVPAAFNGIVGLKCTRGLVPASGVVPASRSYDCVTVFARSLTEASRAAAAIIGPSERDTLSRGWTPDAPLAAPPRPTVGVPRPEDLVSLDSDRAEAFASAAARLEAQGATLVTVDISGMLETATLLYGGALVAERAAAYGTFLADHPSGADPVVSQIAAAAGVHTAVSFVDDVERLDCARRDARETFATLDALLIPTAPAHPTFEEVEAQPIAANAHLGTFTNFMNLLDLCGVAVPAADTPTGGFGVTVVAPAFRDQVAVDIAARLTGEEAPSLRPDDGVPVVVFGAHLAGQPLNYQLTERGARLAGPVVTAPRYRMVALPGALARPGVAPALEPVAHGLEGEKWLVPAASLSDLLADVKAPLALGPLTLHDGTVVAGFVSTDMAGEDITHLGGWRAYVGQSR
ncbi:allophanate hydrolase [Demequina sp. NBRC 110051]|uniref:allophanate hydrolase n=1 Tax=Demequina sp. NBRC 110051 TaxID=1570340 RepID=UPI000A036083|nr:allophanate hydrolase [Demequina sp. NBRC 110051]